MPKKNKASSSDSDSGPEDRNPPKKAKTSKSKSNDDNEHSWCLEKMRFLKVREFKGRVFVDIREFYDKDGELAPGKKGISLSASQWKKLLEYKDEVNAALEQF